MVAPFIIDIFLKKRLNELTLKSISDTVKI